MLFVRSSFIKDWGCDGFAIDCVESLYKNGIPFKIHSGSFIEPNNVPERFKKFQGNKGTPGKEDFTLVINPACFLQHFEIDEKTIVYTFWDADKLPTHHGMILNSARLIMVPSRTTRKAIAPHCPGIPIEVVQPGFSIAFHDQCLHKSPSKTIFGAGGQVVEPKGDRKNLTSVVDCFLKAFEKTDKSVELRLKIENPNHLESHIADKRIIVYEKGPYDKVDSQQKLAEWYNNLDCFINLSKYESFGLMPLEAMACGVPIISPFHSGMKEYLKDGMYLKVGHLPCVPSEFYFKDNWSAEWNQPNLDEVISCMRWVSNRGKDMSKYVGKLGKAHVNKKFNQFHFEDRFIEVIRRFAF